MNDFLAKIAPTVASALLGPLGGVAVAGLGRILGLDGATVTDVSKAISDGRITPDQVAEIRKLELQYQEDEKARGFRYAELQFADTKSARDMQIATHSVTPSILTWIIVALTLSAEIALMFNKVPPGVDPIILGRILGTMDAALMLVLGFWFGTTQGSQFKDRTIAGMASKNS